jgi:hypothetical protein
MPDRSDVFEDQNEANPIVLYEDPSPEADYEERMRQGQHHHGVLV